jgi:flagellar assembly factor FliW
MRKMRTAYVAAQDAKSRSQFLINTLWVISESTEKSHANLDAPQTLLKQTFSARSQSLSKVQKDKRNY